MEVYHIWFIQTPVVQYFIICIYVTQGSSKIVSEQTVYNRPQWKSVSGPHYEATLQLYCHG